MARSQIIGPPPPPPQTGTHSIDKDTAEDFALNAADQAAENVVASLAGNPDAQAQASKCLEAFRTARKAGRVRFIEVPPNRRTDVRAATSPDVMKPRPMYKPGQTNAQLMDIRRDQILSLCPEALAVVMLHEGWRLEQSIPFDPDSVDEFKQVVRNGQQLCCQDMRNINAASGGMPLPPTSQCLDDLRKLMDESKANLEALNKLAHQEVVWVAETPAG